MTKDDLQTICNSVYIKILTNNYNSESIKEKLLPFSSNGKITSEEMAMFVLLESQKFTVKMIQDVLSEVLITDDNASENLLTDK